MSSREDTEDMDNTLMQAPERTAPSQAPTRRTASVLLAVCIVLIGLNLRTVFSSFSAILPEITAASGMPAVLVTALTTGPVLLLGMVAPAAPALARRLGIERTILIAMIVLAAGLAVRGTGDFAAMAAGTVAAGAGIGIVNVLLPTLVKRDFQHRLGLMSGLYTGSICAAAALGAGFTQPLLGASGSWQAALGFWALPAVVVVLLFAPLALRRRPAPDRKQDDAGPSVWRSPLAWQITGFMALQAMMSFSVFAWLAPILRERGIDGAAAGYVVAGSIVVQVLGSFLAPPLAARLRSQGWLNAGIALLTGAGFALTILGPLDLIWVWAVMLGVGQGSLTALALTMIVLRTRDAPTAARVSGMMQCLGYGIGSSGTLLVGVLYTATGSFTPAALMFLGIGAAAAGMGFLAGRSRFVGR
ncbi:MULTISPECIES: MFS transporter [Arthrobacter]|uniref:MFS transporter n=1 Tax=Arthrobacter TaxID=1663 RepID=UPI001D13D0D1|nr:MULTISPECIES: MFS transporter [Arthrobacter]MCC3281879.1 MFS transporter [Arthrobacter caoxuetaonis]MCC3283082.1 MFS transporter [Arthrobacter caoxuetaonis]MCC9194678.1 MFS transporter [Arthrobacter sp. zg-Y916]